MSKELMHFRVDTPALLLEIVNCAMDQRNGILKIPINIFREYLVKVAERAAKLNDPELNILMLEMNLYEVPVCEIVDKIEHQKSLIQ